MSTSAGLSHALALHWENRMIPAAIDQKIRQSLGERSCTRTRNVSFRKRKNKTQGSHEFSRLAQQNQQQLNKTHQSILYSGRADGRAIAPARLSLRGYPAANVSSALWTSLHTSSSQSLSFCLYVAYTCCGIHTTSSVYMGWLVGAALIRR